MDKKTFCKRVAIGIAIVTAIVMLIIGLCFGKVIEGSLFAEVSKWIVMTLVLIGILEGFAYFLAPLIWHFWIDPERKEKVETPTEKMRREIRENEGLLEDSCASSTCAYRGQNICTVRNGEFCPMYIKKK